MRRLLGAALALAFLTPHSAYDIPPYELPVATTIYAEPHPGEHAASLVFNQRLDAQLSVKYAVLVADAAKRFQLEGYEHVLAAQVLVESNGDSLAIGPSTRWGHAQGLAQILPYWWGGVCGHDLFNPKTNLQCQSRAFRWALDMCEQHLRCALNRYWWKGGLHGRSKYTRAVDRWTDDDAL